MKKVLLITCLCFFCHSCFIQNGQWIDGQCRPKRPHFKILKTSFNETNKLIFNKVYIGNTSPFGLGFYPDGRLIWFDSKDGFELKYNDISHITWSNAKTIGYWRVVENNIKIEIFICKDGGYYLEEKGEIKGDTIVFYQNFYDYLLRKEVREERYILSDMGFD